MKITCSMFWDLYPLFEEQKVEEVTQQVMLNHMEDCVQCREQVNEMKTFVDLIENETIFPKKETTIPQKPFRKYHRNMLIDFSILSLSVVIILFTILYSQRDEVWLMRVMGRLELVEQVKENGNKASLYYEKKTGQYWIEARDLHIIDSVPYHLVFNEGGNALVMLHQKELNTGAVIYDLDVFVLDGEKSGTYSFMLESDTVLKLFQQQLHVEGDGEITVSFGRWLTDQIVELHLEMTLRDGKNYVIRLQRNIFSGEINYP